MVFIPRQYICQHCESPELMRDFQIHFLYMRIQVIFGSFKGQFISKHDNFRVIFVPEVNAIGVGIDHFYKICNFARYVTQ